MISMSPEKDSFCQKCTPLVSVIMPVRNEAPYVLKEAIGSILCQTLTDFELIICDDGSDEMTSSALAELATDSRITLLTNGTPQGPACARNRAIRSASGKYIALMDADDVSAEDRLRAEVEFLENNPSFSFVGCKGECFEKIPGDGKRYHWFVSEPVPEDFLMTLPFVHASLMFRKNDLLSIGAYREGRKVWRSEDYDMLLRMYAAGFKGANLPQVLYFIRVDESTYSRRKYRYRFAEMRVKLSGFAKLGLMPKGMVYAFKPLAVGLVPRKMLQRIQNRYYRWEIH